MFLFCSTHGCCVAVFVLTCGAAKMMSPSPDLFGRWTALHVAANQNKFAMVQLLLLAGADPKVKIPGGHTYVINK